MVLAEVASVVDSKVHLVVIRTYHLSAGVVTVGIGNAVEVGIVQIVISGVVPIPYLFNTD